MKTFKWISIVVGLVVISLGIAYYYDHVAYKPTLMNTNSQPSNPDDTNRNPYGAIIGDRMVTMDANGNRVITWKLDGQEEHSLINIMRQEVNGIDEHQAKKLILARLKYNWRDVPDQVKGDDIEGMYSHQLKHEIVEITTNIAEVLTAPIGDVRYPPRMDLIVRSNYVSEIEAIKKN